LAALAPAYRPRRPTETVPYAVVRDHLETFLAHARDTYAAPLPRHVEEELRGYLRCGVFAKKRSPNASPTDSPSSESRARSMGSIRPQKV